MKRDVLEVVVVLLVVVPVSVCEVVVPVVAVSEVVVVLVTVVVFVDVVAAGSSVPQPAAQNASGKNNKGRILNIIKLLTTPSITTHKADPSLPRQKAHYSPTIVGKPCSR